MTWNAQIKLITPFGHFELDYSQVVYSLGLSTEDMQSPKTTTGSDREPTLYHIASPVIFQEKKFFNLL